MVYFSIFIVLSGSSQPNYGCLIYTKIKHVFFTGLYKMADIAKSKFIPIYLISENQYIFMVYVNSMISIGI